MPLARTRSAADASDTREASKTATRPATLAAAVEILAGALQDDHPLHLPAGAEGDAIHAVARPERLRVASTVFHDLPEEVHVGRNAVLVRLGVSEAREHVERVLRADLGHTHRADGEHAAAERRERLRGEVGDLGRWEDLDALDLLLGALAALRPAPAHPHEEAAVGPDAEARVELADAVDARKAEAASPAQRFARLVARARTLGTADHPTTGALMPFPPRKRSS